MRAGEDFFNFHNHDMVRVAVAIPAVRVANPAFNGGQTIALMRQAAERHAAVVLFPELGLPGYSCEDLHQQRVVLDGCLAALSGIVEASRALATVAVVGLAIVSRPSAFQLRRRRPSRTHPRRGAQDLSAQLPRVL